MSLKIDWVEKKTSANGKEYTVATINGKEISVWPDFSQYSLLMAGATIDGELKQNGKYINLVDTAKPQAVYAQSGGGKGIAAAQQRKADMIGEAQDNKAASIKLAACNRDATLITTSQMSDPLNPIEWRNEWLKTRQWLLDNWDMPLGI